MQDIIIVSHNDVEMVARSIRAIKFFTGIPHCLTIMDDSTDDMVEVYTKYQSEHYATVVGDSKLNYYRHDKPFIEFNEVVNKAFELTSSETLVVLTSTTEVEPEWIESPLQVMANVKDCAIVGIKNLFPRSGIIENAGMHFEEPLLHHMNYGSGDAATMWTHVREVQAIGFCCAFLRRKYCYPLPTGEFVGFSGFDDVDTCFQMRERGFKVIYCGYSSSYHHTHGARAGMGFVSGDHQEAIDKYQENRFRFLTKWCTWGEFVKETDDFPTE